MKERKIGTLPLSGRGAARQVPAAFSLAIYHREGAEVVPLDPGCAVVVGRAKPADVVVPDKALSRLHARFTLHDGVLRVEDLGSTNGTHLGGALVDSAELRVGTAVEIGDTRCIVQARGAFAVDLGHVATHERLLEELSRHLVEARHFRESVALLMVEAKENGSAVPVSEWHPKVMSALRSVDYVGMYSGTVLEVILPRADLASGNATAEAIEEVLRGEGLDPTRALAVYPEAGTSAEMILMRCRRGLEAAVTSGMEVVAADDGTDAPDALVAASPAMRLLVAQLDRLAATTMPILIMGETGVGKELIARAIHRRSGRSEAALVPLNCGAIPPQLVESTLFGHERGAFTGASATHLGVFGAAQNGTVLLDEIGELPLSAQASLLRVLETGKVVRVGATEEVDVNVRVIAATHRDLEAMVDNGTFRHDLLYRINALPLVVPPLRRRRQDIALLAEQFLERAVDAVGEHAVTGFTREALEALLHYRWPGNVRELRNIVERACVMCAGELIAPEHLTDRFRAPQDASAAAPVTPPAVPAQPAPVVTSGQGVDLRECMRDLEAKLLTEALHAAGGDATRAARKLNLPVRTFNYKLKNLEIDRSQFGK